MIVILMGVAGSGKTTIGRKLAQALDCAFYDGDDYHSQANKEKMGRGVPLTDADRMDWLQTLQIAMKKWAAESPCVILACSALKQKYRNQLSEELSVQWVYLKGDKEVVRQRLESRRDHFAGPDLLESQFSALEEPPNVLLVDIRKDLDSIVKQLVEDLKGTP